MKKSEPKKSAGVREIKAHLSAYLRQVERGDVVLVTDRGRVVAEMRPPGAADRDVSPSELRYRRLVERGILEPAAGGKGRNEWLSLPGLRTPPGTAGALLDAERGE